jgi:hypothetical protein
MALQPNAFYARKTLKLRRCGGNSEFGASVTAVVRNKYNFIHICI